MADQQHGGEGTRVHGSLCPSFWSFLDSPQFPAWESEVRGTTGLSELLHFTEGKIEAQRGGLVLSPPSTGCPPALLR